MSFHCTSVLPSTRGDEACRSRRSACRCGAVPAWRPAGAAGTATGRRSGFRRRRSGAADRCRAPSRSMPSTIMPPMPSPPPPIGKPPGRRRRMPPPSPRRSSTLSLCGKSSQRILILSVAQPGNCCRVQSPKSNHEPRRRSMNRAETRSVPYGSQALAMEEAIFPSTEFLPCTRHHRGLSVVGPASPTASPESEF